jgi:hypothetical protein
LLQDLLDIEQEQVHDLSNGRVGWIGFSGTNNESKVKDLVHSTSSFYHRLSLIFGHYSQPEDRSAEPETRIRSQHCHFSDLIDTHFQDDSM